MQPIFAGDVLMTLYIIVAVMLIVVLYHVLFIVVDLRKIMRRFNDLTEQVGSVILKPISVADQILEWLMQQLEEWKKKHHTKKSREKKAERAELPS